MDEFYVKLGEKSMEYYTHDEVKSILNFFESKQGKKYLEVQEKITTESMNSMTQELQMKLMPIMQKYMSGQ
jgi:hypothetical protein